MGIKLLLADDSITIQKVVGIIFANEDYELTVVNNGNDALERIRAQKPDILLIDAIMPGKTGFEVSEEIKRDPGLRNIPILILTGAFEPFDEEKAKKCGADDFISKPFESQHLIDKVTALVEHGRKMAPPEDDFATFEVPPLDIYSDQADESLKPASDLPVFPEPAEEPSSPAVLGVQAAASDAAQFKVDVVEARIEDDLWKAFELEVISVSKSPDSGVAAIEDESRINGFEEEPEPSRTVYETSVEVPTAQDLEPATGDEPLIFEEEPVGTGVFEVVAEEPFEVFQEDVREVEASTIDTSELFTMIEPEPGPSDSATPVPPPPSPEEVEIFADEGAAHSIDEELSAAIPSPEAEFEMQFPQEEELVTAPESIAPATAVDDEFEIQFAPDDEGEAVQETIPPQIEPVEKDFEIRLAPEDEFELEDKTLPERLEFEPPGQVAAPSASLFTEEQLTEIVSKISRDILERIAWEVVPDLAERIIQEEIRKIKAG